MLGGVCWSESVGLAKVLEDGDLHRQLASVGVLACPGLHSIRGPVGQDTINGHTGTGFIFLYAVAKKRGQMLSKAQENSRLEVWSLCHVVPAYVDIPRSNFFEAN